MSVVEIERGDGIMVVRMNRPERLNALGAELRAQLAGAWIEFRDSRDLEVAIFTGTGRAFCAGEDMKESVEREKTGEAVAARRTSWAGTSRRIGIAPRISKNDQARETMTAG